jgi:2-C-methyl-D-erythritol 4-phosphate cytidylyltransferase
VVKKFFTSAIIVAGGSGKRFNSQIPKQFLELKGKPILAYSIEKMEKCNSIDEILIAVPRQFTDFTRNMISRYKFKKIFQIISGGSARQASVYNGLQKVNKKCNLVLVHDGVRPLIESKQIEQVIKLAQKSKAAILALPVKETVKLVDKNTIVKTEDRKKFYLAQTPQAFEKTLLSKAFERAKKANFVGTDCSSLVERLGVKVRILEGSEKNIKITTAEDLGLAEKLISR